jgi:hypothetical protein
LLVAIRSCERRVFVIRIVVDFDHASSVDKGR